MPRTGGGTDLLKDDGGLAPHLQVPEQQDSRNLAILREDGLQGILDLFTVAVDIHSVVWGTAML